MVVGGEGVGAPGFWEAGRVVNFTPVETAISMRKEGISAPPGPLTARTPLLDGEIHLATGAEPPLDLVSRRLPLRLLTLPLPPEIVQPPYAKHPVCGRVCVLPRIPPRIMLQRDEEVGRRLRRRTRRTRRAGARLRVRRREAHALRLVHEGDVRLHGGREPRYGQSGQMHGGQVHAGVEEEVAAFDAAAALPQLGLALRSLRGWVVPETLDDVAEGHGAGGADLALAYSMVEGRQNKAREVPAAERVDHRANLLCPRTHRQGLARGDVRQRPIELWQRIERVRREEYRCWRIGELEDERVRHGEVSVGLATVARECEGVMPTVVSG